MVRNDEPMVRTEASRRHALALIAVGIAAAFALSWNLGDAPLWEDEAYSIVFARMPWSDLWQQAHHIDGVVIAYYAMIHLACGGHVTIVGARIWSAVCTIATLPFVYAIGRATSDRRTALVGTVLLMSNVLVWQESREARMYGPLLFAATASWYFLLRTLEAPTRVSGAAYVVASLAALALHPLAALNFVSQIVASAVDAKDDRSRNVAFALQGLVALVSMPIALVIFGWHSDSNISWIERPTPIVLWRAAQEATGGRLSAGIAIIALTAATVAAAVATRRQRYSRTLLAWFLGPLALGVASSWIAHPIFTPRYFIETAPAAALLVARLVVALRPAVFGALALAVVLVAAAKGGTERARHPKMDWRIVASTLQHEAKTGDPLIVLPAGLTPTYTISREQLLSGDPVLDVVYPPATVTLSSSDRADAGYDVPPGLPAFWLLTKPRDETMVRRKTLGYCLVQLWRAEDLTLERYRPGACGESLRKVKQRVTRLP